MTVQTNETDTVTRIIQECLTGRETAEKIYQDIVRDKKRTLKFSDIEIKISDKDVGEFVDRYSSEVEPTLWVSKSRKDVMKDVL